MRILFVSSIIPWPANVGAILRSLSLIEALERLGDVDFLFFSDSKSILSTPFAQNRKILDVLPRPRFLPYLGYCSLTKLLDWNKNKNEWLPYYIPSFNNFLVLIEKLKKKYMQLI